MTTTLPATGHYLVIVGEYPQGTSNQALQEQTPDNRTCYVTVPLRLEGQLSGESIELLGRSKVLSSRLDYPRGQG